ncbi:hypothetical protein [Hymenobacter ruricola]|uniref:Lipoprotein n=1 Tax=Hymenobacter ruricola TaxID=2791023 RepID=A0ABS0I0X8_9BACT|nr:hypothetical protein [Hymenobacter ruricola]MBF9220431.1 hypothetical protein [Hymenobacter ruricola]
MPPRLFATLLALGALSALLGGCARKNFFQPDARPDAVRAQPLPAATDSVRGATAGRQYARHGRLYGALVGQHHRRSWAAPVTVPVLRLSNVYPEGLTPGKVGGGFNSTSLNLKTVDGKGYVLRTVDKDPIRATPVALRKTFLVNVLRDNVSSTNPYAALTVPPLAEAAGVPHTSPRLFYVRPEDPLFQGDSLRLFRGQLAYLEEKTSVPVASQGEILSSTQAFGEVFKKPTHRLDQAALLRARLLDAWLGDWDRHAGQWNWLATAANGQTRIAPLPKDRDMVYYRLDDGALGWLIGHLFLRHWATFKAHFANEEALLSNGKYLDDRGLNELTRAQFQATAQALQQRLPDTLVARALRRLPPAAYALEGPRTTAALQTRRAELPALAERWYRRLARRPVIGGTAKAERFEIHRYADSTVVVVSSVAQLAGSVPFYHRAFLPAETHQIQLEGLGGDDVFTVENHGVNATAQPRVRIYGGEGTDELRAGGSNKGMRFNQGSVPAKHAYDKLPEE